MASIMFIFNEIRKIIQCKKEDLMKDLCQKFASNINIEFDKLYFFYEGQEVNYELTFNKQAKENDKQNYKMNVLVCQIKTSNNNENFRKIKSRDIICPKCGEICLLNIKEYNISFYGCKNGDKLNNILLDEYENIQKINQTTIICENCKNKDISNNNEFFKCLLCDTNLCSICKSKHNENHSIINYGEKNYTCKNHKEKFNSYCNKCKINLCKICESNHEDKDNLIYYKDVIPQQDTIKSQIEELKIKIDKCNAKIKELIKILNNISKNMEIYYKINYNIFDNYNKNNINYELLKNINEIIKKMI